VLGIYAFALHKELGQVLRFPVCNGPSVVFNFKSGLFLLVLVSDGDIVHRLIIIIISLNYWDWFWLRESFILNLILFGIFFFIVELEANHCRYFSNVLLNLKQLIHISKFKSVIVEDEFSTVA